MALPDGVASVRDLDLEHQRTFIRLDLDCSLTDEATPDAADDARIQAALPTIRLALDKGARVVLAAHRGTPKGRGYEEKLSLEPVGARLAELLGVELLFPHEDCVGDAARKVVRELRDGQIVLLENLGFHPEEEQGDEPFAQKLAEFADVYVDDALAVADRGWASVFALPRLVRARGMGLAFERELEALARLQAPERPFLAVLGGEMSQDRIALFERLLERADAVLVGGQLATTFFAATGGSIGASHVDADKLALARTLLDKARFGRGGRSVEIVLPVDVMVAPTRDASEGSIYDATRVPSGEQVLDVGPRTIEAFATRVVAAKTVLFSGPVGRYENPRFADGSRGVARALADAPGFTVVVGGDTAAAVRAAGDEVVSKIDHVSAGDAAAFALLTGKRLPGVEALRGLRS